MDRIASLTILKDASAKAIYGSRAANGVIVIETKRSETGDINVTYTGNVTFEVPDLTSYNLTNAAQKLELERDFGLYETHNEEENIIGDMLLKQQYMQKYKSVLAGVNTDWLAKPLRWVSDTSIRFPLNWEVTTCGCSPIFRITALPVS